MTQPLAKAELVINGQTIPVQFNPVSLQVEISNSASPQSGNGATTQVATQSSAKLGLDLLFDTTSTGEDVRNKTRALRATVRAPQEGGGNASGGSSAAAGAAFVPPHVTFQWGTFIFAGIADSYRETLDYFSADGVPLRAQVALALKEAPNEFTALERPNPRGAASTSAFEVPAELQGLSGAAGVARQGGDLRAARAIAGANGEESLRFGSGKTLAVDTSVQLREAVGFVGGGGGGGAGGAGGIGIGIGGSAGIGVDIGTGGAGGAPALRFDAGQLVAKLPARQLATDAGAGFAIDGRALPVGQAGLRSDVGLNQPLSARLRFDG